MRVRLIGEMSGTRDGQQWPSRGSTVDLPDDEALMLVRNRMAVLVAEVPVETAVVAADADEERALTTESAAALSRRTRAK